MKSKYIDGNMSFPTVYNLSNGDETHFIFLEPEHILSEFKIKKKVSREAFKETAFLEVDVPFITSYEYAKTKFGVK